MTLTANLGLRPFVEERGLFSNLGKLESIGGFFHDGVTINAGDPPARVGTCFPIGLDTTLVTTKARFVLDFGRFSRIFAERDQPANTFAATGRNVITSWAVAALASLLFHRVARIVQENLAHYRGVELFERGNMACSANFGAGIGRGLGFRRVGRSRPRGWNQPDH